GEPATGEPATGEPATSASDAAVPAPATPGPDGQTSREPAEELVPEPKVPAVALVGRPNVGKSTLFNRLVGEDRSVTHDLPGTTTDAIDTVVETPEGAIRFVDTAGLRRKSRIGRGPEYYSLVRALQAIDAADVAIVVLDASEGVTHQDQRLAERVDAAGSPVIVVANKWDLLDREGRERLRLDVADRLGFLAYAPFLPVSARTGLGVHRLLPALQQSLLAYGRRVPTRELNQVVQAAQRAQPAPGARILYATQGAIEPPTVTLFATSTLPAPWLRYLERSIREHFGLGPTPLHMRVRRRDGTGARRLGTGGRR
ncbi:MAG: GTP-binding protein, partial [Acidimicrobiales bacterium]